MKTVEFWKDSKKARVLKSSLKMFSMGQQDGLKGKKVPIPTMPERAVAADCL